MKLKVKDIPVLRDRLIKEQDGKCLLCAIDLSTVVACLDHDHETGLIRGVLCQNCNGIEGKITNLARRAKRNSRTESKGRATRREPRDISRSDGR
jgi:5-methylcytosine-specific restriction endonuclease McrA